MTGSMPLRNVSKGPIWRKTEALFVNAVKRATVLKRGLQGDPFHQIGIEEGFLTPAEVDLASRTWFADEPPGFWPNYENKLAILTEGIRKALELSLDFHFDPDRPSTQTEVDAKIIEIAGNQNYGKPVVTFWICAGHHFQCVVAESDQQVTLLILTPSFPDNVVPEKPMTQHQKLWLVSNKDEADALRSDRSNAFAAPRFRDSARSARASPGPAPSCRG